MTLLAIIPKINFVKKEKEMNIDEINKQTEASDKQIRSDLLKKRRRHLKHIRRMLLLK